MTYSALRCLIVGTGSIGRRHIRNLQQLVDAPQFILFRREGSADAFSTQLGARVVSRPEDALALQPDLAVVANPTMFHVDVLEWLLPAGVPCYVEKPVVATLEQWHRLQEILDGLAIVPPTIVGCNLRFLGSLQRLRDMVAGGALGRVVRATFQVGQWLPDWRPAQDYRKGYSASVGAGGGVVLDLVHELDAVRWILGEFDQLHAVGGKYSRLEIESEDAASIIMGRAAGPAVNVGLDYVSRRPLRHYEIVGDEASIHWDLPAMSMSVSTSAGVRSLAGDSRDYDVSSTYIAAMKELLDAVAGCSATTQNVREGLKSAALALAVNDLLRSP